MKGKGVLPQGFCVLEICVFILDFNEEMGLFIMMMVMIIMMIMMMIMIIYSHITERYVQYNTSLAECNCTDFAL